MKKILLVDEITSSGETLRLGLASIRDQGPQEILNQEKMHLLNRLWKITLDKVDETML